MSSSQRKREYARRRDEKWQQRQVERSTRSRARRQRLLVLTTVVTVLAVVGGVFWLSRAGDDPATTAAEQPGAEQPAPEETDAAGADNPCPAPTATAPTEPVQLDAVPDPGLAEGRTWTATITTSCGDVAVELLGEQAPQAVASFLALAEQGYFADTPCHRLTTAGIFVLQCGDPTGTGTGGPGYEFGPVENAPSDDLYPAGTLAMARRGGDAESQGSQFFLVYEDSTIPSDAAGGYTVFGRVTEGLDVVQQVAGGGVTGGGTDGQPTRAITIEQVSVSE